ncbi:MAG: branched-chain amino acid transporter AzlC [Peptococcaceae bacterium]|nr:branched-chain amino acid transporter AzlC [Peptococcaceae bacterium]
MNIVRPVEVSRGKRAAGQELWQGIADSLPVMLGVTPFGITCGVMGLTAGLTGMETLLMSMLVFAGASQFVSITMLGAGITSWSVIVLTTLLINLRHFLMGASLAPYMTKLPLYQQALLAFGLVDESYVLTISRTGSAGYSPYYQFGVNTALYLAWVLSTAAGVLVGRSIADPLAWGLDFAMPATFLVLLMPRLVDRISLYVCWVAAVAAVAGALYLPGKWYIIVSCLLASTAGGILERKNSHAQ